MNITIENDQQLETCRASREKFQASLDQILKGDTDPTLAPELRKALHDSVSSVIVDMDAEIARYLESKER